jgi:hypothetical protein
MTGFLYAPSFASRSNPHVKGSNMDSVRAKHAAELEAKRKKLEEIRKRKAAVRCVYSCSLLSL